MNIKDRLRLVAQDPRKSPELQQLLLDAAEEIERLHVSIFDIDRAMKANFISRNIAWQCIEQTVRDAIAQQDKKE